MKLRSWIFLSFIPLILVNLAIFNNFFPPTEGWWQTYSYLMEKGLLMYKDFNVNLSPVFIIFNYFLVKIIGYNFYLIRILGIILVTFNYFLLYRYLSKIFSKESSIIAAFFSTMLFINDPIYIPNDYHTFMNFFVLLVLNLSSDYIVNKKENPGKANLFLITMGFLASLLIFIKQNVGLFLLFSFFPAILLLKDNSKYKIRSLFSYIAGIFVFLLVFFVLVEKYDIYSYFFNFIFKNDSKGSLWVVLFRFLSPGIAKDIFGGGVVFIIILFIQRIANTKLRESVFINDFFDLTYYLFFLYLMLSPYLEKKFPLFSPFNLFVPVAIGVFLYVIKKSMYDRGYGYNEGLMFSLFPVLTLAYCSTHTAGFSFTGLYFFISFSYAYLVDKVYDIFPRKKKYVNALFVMIFIPVLINKIFVPYNWWGLNQSSIFDSKYSLPYPELKGINVDKITSSFFNDLKESIELYSKKDDDVYLFPNIPLFYLLSNKIPPTRNLVQWFDVITSEQIEKEVEYIRQNSPRVVVLLIPPKFVFQGHLDLIGRDLYQEKIINLMETLSADGKYRFLFGKIYINEKKKCFNDYYSCCRINISIYPQRKYINKKLSFLIKTAFTKYNASFKNLGLCGNNLYTFNYDRLLTKDDVVSFEVNINRVNDFLSEFGEPYSKTEERYYLYKIYIRNN